MTPWGCALSTCILAQGPMSLGHQGHPPCSQLEDALDGMLCMPSRHHAIGLQDDCMVVVPASVVRPPDSHVYALWP
jgi:hypothetical protein